MRAEVEGASGGAIDGVVACAGIGVAVGEPTAITRVNYFGAIATLSGLRDLRARGDNPRAAAICSLAMLLERDPAVFDALLADDEDAAVAAAAQTTGARVYAATKLALARWIRRNAPTDAWAGAKIPLNGIAPGRITSPMTAHLTSGPNLEATRAAVPQPLGDFGDTNAPASLLAWLVSAENSFVTGQIIMIDGGHEALRRGEDIW